MTLPYLEHDGSVRFATREAFAEHFDAFLSKGALCVQATSTLKPFERIAVTLRISGFAPVGLEAELTSSNASCALLRLGALTPEIRRQLEAIAASAADPPAFSASAQGPPARLRTPNAVPSPAPVPSLASRGTFRNPTSAQQYLALPMVRPPTAAEVASPSLPLVVLWLAGRKSESIRFRVRTSSEREVECWCIEGTVYSPVPLDSLAHTLAEPEGDYEVAADAPATRPRYRVNVISAEILLLKELLKRYLEPELAAAMSGRHGEAPAITERGSRLRPRLAFSDAQLRIVNRLLTGEYALDEVLHNGIGIRTSWQVVYLLEVLGGLEWREARPRSALLVDELQTLLKRVRIQDHFTALGLHLSSSPRSVERVYGRLRAMYGPGSPAYALSRPVAESIWRRFEEGYAVIRTPAGRKAYRREAFPESRLDYAAELVTDQASLAAMRKDFDHAAELLEAALELDPTAARLEEYKRVLGLAAEAKAAEAAERKAAGR